MDLSPIGRAVLRAREGERLTAYKDSVGVWTIGVGITTASGLIVVRPGLRITRAESARLFAQAVETYVDPVRRALAKPVPQEFFDACASLAYNIGPVRFAESTIVRKANAGDLAGAAEAFLLWNRPAAILPRRRAERDQARTPYARALPRARAGDAAPVPAGPPPGPAPRPPDPMAPLTRPGPARPAPSGGPSAAGRAAPAPSGRTLARG
ncbi:lysozyme [Methylobacterium sp. WSM2598]|uniref:lysozyme n=1 Tax=Methylobacterium sp. WSM2598 TaxID=398261 RepID=UPI00037854D6|nr:lysozyme [Methylobacterium sp. WSM2598]